MPLPSNFRDIVAFVFIAGGLVLIDQAIFWADPIKATAVAGAALILFGAYIWFTGGAKGQQPKTE